MVLRSHVLQNMNSDFKRIWKHCPLPDFTGLRILHMPIRHGDPASVPDFLGGYSTLLDLCAALTPQHVGKVVYLTVDERDVEVGKTHRRPRLHVDGWHKTEQQDLLYCKESLRIISLSRQKYILDGCEYVRDLPPNKAIIRLPKHQWDFIF